jgi:hypothetical protein
MLMQPLLSSGKKAEELNIPKPFVETNCFWCKDDETTRDRLLKLNFVLT